MRVTDGGKSGQGTSQMQRRGQSADVFCHDFPFDKHANRLGEHIQGCTNQARTAAATDPTDRARGGSGAAGASAVGVAEASAAVGAACSVVRG